jgi:6-phosphofructokinase 2
MTGARRSDEEGLIEAGRDLIANERVNIIALTLGPRGAMLITRDRVLRAEAFPIKMASVVGAGDSFLGTITWSLARGDDLRTALSFGVAGGSAALLSPGTDLCRPEDVQRLMPEVMVRPVKLGVG